MLLPTPPGQENVSPLKKNGRRLRPGVRTLARNACGRGAIAITHHRQRSIQITRLRSGRSQPARALMAFRTWRAMFWNGLILFTRLIRIALQPTLILDLLT